METIRVQMNEDYYCEIRKYIGSHGEYYSVNNVDYDIHFPIDWVFQIPENIDINLPFGPETCYDCFLNGYCNGVFIGYCVNCAYTCNYKRGNGLIYKQEQEGLDTNNSIWNLYLQTISSFDEIGDRQLYIEYEYKTQYSHRLLNYITNLKEEEEEENNNNDNDNDDITVAYNDSFVYYSVEYEDDNTVTFFSYEEYDDIDIYDDNNTYDIEEIDSIS